MKHTICSTYDMHIELMGKCRKYQPRIISFLKTVAFNTASNLFNVSPANIDEVYIEEFKYKNPDINEVGVLRVSEYIRGEVRMIMQKYPNLKDGSFEIISSRGNICIDEYDLIPDIPKPNIKYDVPWGSPAGTILVEHLDVVTIAPPYIWCDDDEPCDVIIGEKLFIVTHGLWAYANAELTECTELEKSTMDNKVINRGTPFPMDFVRTKCNHSEPVALNTNNYHSIGGKKHLIIMSEGVYIDHDVEYISVDLMYDMVDNGERRVARPLLVTINSVEYLIKESGTYKIDESTLEKVCHGDNSNK